MQASVGKEVDYIISVVRLCFKWDSLGLLVQYECCKFILMQQFDHYGKAYAVSNKSFFPESPTFMNCLSTALVCMKKLYIRFAWIFYVPYLKKDLMCNNRFLKNRKNLVIEFIDLFLSLIIVCIYLGDVPYCEQRVKF